MEKFEYRTVVYKTPWIVGGKVDEDKLQSTLNTLGSEGWDLVSSVSTSQGNGVSRGIVLFFKRKITG